MYFICTLVIVVLNVILYKVLKTHINSMKPLRTLSEHELSKIRCGSCGCLHTMVPCTDSEDAEVQLNGAEPFRCYICGSITITNKVFAEMWQNMIDPDYVGKVVIHRCTLAVLNDVYPLNNDILVWLNTMKNNTGGAKDAYVDGVIKQAKAQAHISPMDRLNYIIAKDLNAAFMDK